MTFRILKSQVDRLGYDFAAAVVDHHVALEQHRDSGDAAPHSHAEVEAAVRRVQHPIEAGKPDDFVIDYEIVDDTPPPPALPTLAERKAVALAELRRQEQADIDAIFPVETRRLADITYRAAMVAADQARAARQEPAAGVLKIIVERESLNARLADIDLDYARREAALAGMT